MADLINVRARPGVRINLHPADIVNIVTQPEVIASFTEGEMREISSCLQSEINYRENRNRKENKNESSIA